MIIILVMTNTINMDLRSDYINKILYENFNKIISVKISRIFRVLF